MDYRAEFFENSEMLISLYDKELNLIDANATFLKVLNLKKEDWIGRNINELSPDCKSSGRYYKYEEVIRTGIPFVIDQVRLHPNLGSIYIRLSAFKVGDGLGISSKEITDLVDTIQDLETLIYKTSHDVRSPIATMLGLINVAMLDHRHDPAISKYFEMIRQQAERLDHIVKKLIETENIRQMTASPDSIDLEAEVDELLDSFAAQKDFDRISIEKDIHLKRGFRSDKRLVRIILHHLILNALTYHDFTRQPAFVRITILETESGVRVRIEDNGLGIADSLKDDLFKMFVKGGHTGDGTGLGLYAVKQSVRKLKGQISIDTTPGGGTTFTVDLPSDAAE